jgi:hypothetical protein
MIQELGQLTSEAKNYKYRTIVVSAVSYGCESWSLTLRDKHGLRVFENRVLRKLFGPKWEEVTGQN